MIQTAYLWCWNQLLCQLSPGGGPRPLKVCSKSLFPIKVRGNFGKGNLDFYQNSLLGKLRWREEREIFEKTYAQCDLIG